MDSMPMETIIPDGGWGWVVVAAVALINMTNQSILSVFGLLFGGQLKVMQQETSTAALITNLNSLALNFSGFLIGPAIKNFKPRNVCATGCVLVSFGMFLCAFATQTWHFIIGYSFCVGLGLGLIAPSTFMAINSYFTTKRGRAVGISLAGAGLGQVCIPHLVRIFLDNYGFRIAVLAMSVLSLTGLFGALLLKPLQSTSRHNNRQHITPLLGTDDKTKHNSEHVQIINTAASNERIYKDTVLQRQEPRHEKLCSKICQRFVQAMDLELLLDPIFLSIILGMSMVYTSTIQFSMLFPSFLQYSVGLSTASTATCMSVVAGADNICRILLPFITDKLKIPYRLVFLFGTVGLLISRAALAESVEMTPIIVMSIFTGMTKSATVLNNNLTISGHCRPEKLAGGLGLNMISKGVIVITIGQLLGWIHDYTNSYIICLHAQNMLLLFVILVWTPEIYYRYWRQRRQQKQQQQQSINQIDKTIKMSSTPAENAKMNPC